jgi:hypothetical protein
MGVCTSTLVCLSRRSHCLVGHGLARCRCRHTIGPFGTETTGNYFCSDGLLWILGSDGHHHEV